MGFLDNLKDKAEEFGDKAKEGFEAAKDKASDLVDDVKDRLRQRRRERHGVEAADHPADEVGNPSYGLDDAVAESTAAGDLWPTGRPSRPPTRWSAAAEADDPVLEPVESRRRDRGPAGAGPGGRAGASPPPSRRTRWSRRRTAPPERREIGLTRTVGLRQAGAGDLSHQPHDHRRARRVRPVRLVGPGPRHVRGPGGPQRARARGVHDLQSRRAYPGAVHRGARAEDELKNRIHFDLRPTDGTRDEEVERVLGLGATVVADRRRDDGSGWFTLADPEGNEFCILQGRLGDRRPVRPPGRRSGVGPADPSRTAGRIRGDGF